MSHKNRDNNTRLARECMKSAFNNFRCNNKECKNKQCPLNKFWDNKQIEELGEKQ